MFCRVSKSLKDKLAEIKEQLGVEMFAKLIEANEVDLGIWETL
jgi:hypothetical protein